jgi:hypothetical protein
LFIVAVEVTFAAGGVRVGLRSASGRGDEAGVGRWLEEADSVEPLEPEGFRGCVESVEKAKGALSLHGLSCVGVTPFGPNVPQGSMSSFADEGSSHVALTTPNTTINEFERI